MKKQIMRVLVVVLCCCFVFVAQVDAATLEYNTVDDFYVLFQSVAIGVRGSNSGSTYFYSYNKGVYEAEYEGNKYSFPMVANTDGSPFYSIMLKSVYLPYNGEFYTAQFSLIFVPLSYRASTSTITYDFDSMMSYFSCDADSYEIIEFDLIMGDIVRTVQAVKCNYSFDVDDNKYFNTSFSFYNEKNVNNCYGPSRFLIGMFSPYVSTGLTDEEKTLLQMIMLGVDNANIKLDEMQAEQSSYYDEMITPNESNQSAVESMESARNEGQQVVDEYSSLNASLEKPNVDELLPDYDRVVDGYVDTSIFGVFSTLYESGYIMFMILITVFFGVMSYVLFGKKA